MKPQETAYATYTDCLTESLLKCGKLHLITAKCLERLQIPQPAGLFSACAFHLPPALCDIHCVANDA